MLTCVQCGNQLPLNAKFCNKCGHTVGQEPKKIVRESCVRTGVCPNCGKVLSAAAKFCGKCGAAVKAGDCKPGTAVKTAPGLTGTRGDPFTGKPGTGVPGQKTEPLESKPSLWETPAGKRKKPRTKASKKIGIIVVILVLAAAGGFGVWYYLGHRSGQKGEIRRPEYTVQDVVTGTTVRETKEAVIRSGSGGKVALNDNSSVSIDHPGADAKVTLSRETNDIKPGLKGVSTSGSMLSLKLVSAGNINTMKLVVTIPKSQAGKINPATISIMRVGDIIGQNGEVLKDHVDFLPVHLDQSGNYVANDVLFPFTAVQAGNAQTSQSGVLNTLRRMLFPEAQAGEFIEGMNWVGNVKYSLSTFQGSLNWEKNPRFVQMTPVDNSYGRRPATKEEREKRTKPIVNVVVLVHGHNETEKGGDIESETGDIWEFNYKRDVWTKLYRKYLELSEAANTKDLDGNLNDCTVFYEFIYPTYHPIYTPVAKENNSIVAHKTLGEDLWDAMQEEFYENNPVISKMIKEHVPFNLFLVGHSMGGLVARAGIRFFDGEIKNNFRQLITWGTPHQGSPLISLSYILSAGFSINIEGYEFYPYYDATKKASAFLMMDTPGSRDLRWTSGNSQVPKFFNFGMFVQNENTTPGEDNNLRTSPVFFNNNLREFNDRDHNTDKYTFFYGTTSGIANIKKDSWLLTKFYCFATSTALEQGAFLIKALSDGDMLAASDGAVPVYSQQGKGLFPFPKNVDMGDVTHEGFYEAAGEATAAKTFEIMNGISKCDCPTVDKSKISNDTITGTLSIPFDPIPRKRVDKISASIIEMPGKKVLATSSDFKMLNQDGEFMGTIEPPEQEKDKAKNAVTIVNFQFTDGSQFDFNAGNNEDSPVGSEYFSFFVSQGRPVWTGELKSGPMFTEIGDDNFKDAVLAWKGNSFSFKGNQAKGWYLSASGEVSPDGRSCNVRLSCSRNYAEDRFMGYSYSEKGQRTENKKVATSYTYNIELRDIPFRMKEKPKLVLGHKGLYYPYTLPGKEVARHTRSFDIRYKEDEKSSKATDMGYTKGDTLLFDFFKLVK
jgi:ribosomal protein L40E